MEGYTLQQLMNALGSSADKFDKSFLDTEIKGVSTDSRIIRKDDVFFAISGENFDGAEFVEMAYKSGALLSVVDKESARRRSFTSPVVSVDNTIRALGRVAKDYQSGFSGKVIAVTGTNGKTTAKEMMLDVLGKSFKVNGTKGNYNNHIGLPLSILDMEKKHNCAVLELGMSAPGEIAYLADITKPDIGVILNIGPGHAESFTGLEEIAEAKMELLDSIKSGGTAVINGDDELLKSSEKRFSHRIVKFGIYSDSDYKAENIEIQENGCAEFYIEGNKIKLNIPGLHNVYNALSAYAVGRIIGIDGGEIAQALGKSKAPKMRMERFEKNGIHYINDSYNANPSSMKAAAEVLKTVKAGRKIAILGDMLELGDLSDESHVCIGELFGRIGIEWLCFVGKNKDLYKSGALKSGMKPEAIRKFSDLDSAIEFINKIKRKGDLIFAKGSRAMGMEKIFNTISGVD